MAVVPGGGRIRLWRRGGAAGISADLNIFPLSPPELRGPRAAMTTWQRWLTALLGVTLLVVVSYLWIDRPLALLVHAHFARQTQTVVDPLARIPDPLVPAAVIVFVGLGLWVMRGRALPRLPATLVTASLSVTMTEAFKNQLKYLFGRTWPDTWSYNNPSFIHDSVYGFNWFHGGAAFASFPSGHMAATCAAVSVLWLGYPRFRLLYLAAALVVATTLIGANYHFLSDVIAGAFVGAWTGWMTTLLTARLGNREKH